MKLVYQQYNSLTSVNFSPDVKLKFNLLPLNNLFVFLLQKYCGHWQSSKRAGFQVSLDEVNPLKQALPELTAAQPRYFVHVVFFFSV